MRFPFPAIAAACIAAAAPSFGQDATPQDVARLETMTCREFLTLDAGGQASVRAAMQAHVSDEPLPDAPLLVPDASPKGAAGVVEDRTGADRTEAPAAEPAAPGGGTGAPEVITGENESGKLAPDGTEVSVTDEGGDRRLVAMRTSCEGGPDALALNALRAAFGNNL